MDELFWDNTAGGYFNTSGADPSIKVRVKEDYDGAEPAASSIAAQNLIRLAALLPGPSTSSPGSETPGGYQQRGALTLTTFQERLFTAAIALPRMSCSAYLQLKQPMRQVIVAGAYGSPAFQGLLDAVHTPFVPDKTVLLLDPSDSTSLSLFEAHNPAAVAMVKGHFAAQPGSGPTVFICQNYTCQAPTLDPEAVVKLLTQQGAPKPAVDPNFKL